MQVLGFMKKKSNEEIVEEVILEQYNQYYRLAYGYVHNEADASDIVQNGAYKAIRSSHTLKKIEYAETWVYRIMLNECFQYYKRPKSISYETIQQDVDLQRAIDSLEDKDKAIIILKYFEDKKLEEIADILEENVNTIKSRLYRNMKKLRTVLSD